MADFGDEIGSEAMQQLRFGAMHGGGIMSRLLDWAVSRNPADDNAPIDPRTGEKIEQLDFDTPDDAKAFADALAERGFEAGVAASSVVVRRSDMDALIESGGLAEIGLSAQRAAEAARAATPASRQRDNHPDRKSKLATESQMNLIGNLHDEGIISDEEMSALGDSPTVLQANALLNAHQNDAPYTYRISMDGQCDEWPEPAAGTELPDDRIDIGNLEDKKEQFDDVEVALDKEELESSEKETREPMPRVRDEGRKCEAASNQLSAERATQAREKTFQRELPVRG